jgi:DNA modification methylase
MMIAPYYETARGKLYHADCLDILPEIEQVDLCLTDPPYGIGASSKKFINGTSKTKKDYYEDICWDTKTPDKEVFDLIIKHPAIIWGGNYFLKHLANTRCFLIWDKTIHGNSYADCELAWTNFDKVARIKSINMVEANNDGRVHPTQKPLKLFKWCLKHYSKENDLILDPFLGSGTTAVACEDLNRRWIGCEISEKYCELASKRIEQFLSQGKLF